MDSQTDTTYVILFKPYDAKRNSKCDLTLIKTKSEITSVNWFMCVSNFRSIIKSN